jgi:hypothetical protein
VPHASAHLALVADTTDEAEKSLCATMPGWLARTGEYRRIDTGQPRRRDLTAYLDHLLAIHPVGPSERCVERLTATLDITGAQRLLLVVEGAGDRTAPRRTSTASAPRSYRRCAPTDGTPRGVTPRLPPRLPPPRTGSRDHGSKLSPRTRGGRLAPTCTRIGADQ